MGAILLAITGLDPKPWYDRFRLLAPQRDVRLWGGAPMMTPPR